MKGVEQRDVHDVPWVSVNHIGYRSSIAHLDTRSNEEGCDLCDEPMPIKLNSASKENQANCSHYDRVGTS